jgi:hypothetical protein
MLPSLPANGHWLKALVLLMGDGYDAPIVTAGKETGTSEVFGTGKLKVHRPNALPGPAQFMIDDYELKELEEIIVPFPSGGLPANLEVWKWAVHIYHPDMNEMPWVLTEVRDACNGNALIAGDYQFGPVKYISLTPPLLQTGDCLEMRIYGMSVPPGGVEVYSAAYYASDDPNDH